jgi:hypothetical protein
VRKKIIKFHPRFQQTEVQNPSKKSLPISPKNFIIHFKQFFATFLGQWHLEKSLVDRNKLENWVTSHNRGFEKLWKTNWKYFSEFSSVGWIVNKLGSYGMGVDRIFHETFCECGMYFHLKFNHRAKSLKPKSELLWLWLMNRRNVQKPKSRSISISKPQRF